MTPSKQNTTKYVIAAIVVLVVVLIGLVVALALTPQTSNTSISAQVAEEEEAKALKEAEEEGYYDTDPIEVVDLTELIGLDLNAAIKLIGHGAEIEGEPTSVAGGLTEVTVLLGEESATIQTGTSFVSLYLNRAGLVVQASYQMNINSLSCAKLPFDQIINDAHLIERLLVGAGLVDFTPNPITAPKKQDYALYDSSGKTTTEERYRFTGEGTDAEGRQLEWSVFLDYDYAQAIETNNLANTVRTASVSISAL